MKRILICGLPGTGKTTLAQELINRLTESNKIVMWYNADNVRKAHDDWDFSEEGRIRQAKRMRNLCDELTHFDYVICDFVAPTQKLRDIFEADYTIWMNTEEKSVYEDTNKVFEEPMHADFIVLKKEANEVSKAVLEDILRLK